VEWGALAKAQAGVITRAQLRSLGRSEQVIDRMLAQGALAPLYRGVHIVRGAPVTPEARLWAAALFTSGVLGYATAAHLWGFVENAPDRIHVIVPRAARVRAPAGIRVHHTGAGVACERRDGLPVTSRVTTLLDPLGALRPDQARRLTDRALQRGWLQPADLLRRVEREPRRPGNGLLRRLAAECGDGAAAESERVLHRVLRRHGITGWRANHRVVLGGGQLAVVDLAFVAERVAVEVDGWAYHVDPDRFQGDRSRQNRLTAAGWIVVRFTWADLVEKPDEVVAMIQIARTRGALSPAEAGQRSPR